MITENSLFILNIKITELKHPTQILLHVHLLNILAQFNAFYHVQIHSTELCSINQCRKCVKGLNIICIIVINSRKTFSLDEHPCYDLFGLSLFSNVIPEQKRSLGNKMQVLHRKEKSVCKVKCGLGKLISTLYSNMIKNVLKIL